MQAFHNDPFIKQMFIDRVRSHRLADDFIRGNYWNGFKGCAIGCTVEKGIDVHKEYEIQLGIDRSIAYIEDTLFECMSWHKALEFPEKFLKSINVGASLSNVLEKFFMYLIFDDTYGIFNQAPDNSRAVIASVSNLLNDIIEGKYVRNESWWNLDEILQTDILSQKFANRSIIMLISCYRYYDYNSMPCIMNAGSAYARKVESDFIYLFPNLENLKHDVFSGAYAIWMDAASEKLIELLESYPSPTSSNIEYDVQC